jgi:hypothetical protein
VGSVWPHRSQWNKSISPTASTWHASPSARTPAKHAHARRPLMRKLPAARGYSTMSWQPTGSPNRYDCRKFDDSPSVHVWSRWCGRIALRYEHHQPELRKLRWVDGFAANASRMLRQLHRFTVVILGASHEAALQCSLMCWFVSQGASVEEPSSGGRLLMRLGGAEVSWTVADCLRKGDCAMDMQKSDCSVEHLRRLAGEAGKRPMLVLYGDCGSYAHSQQYAAVHCGMRGVNTSEFTALRALGLLPGLCQGCRNRHSPCSTLEGAAGSAGSIDALPAHDGGWWPRSSDNPYVLWRELAERAVNHLRSIHTAGCARGVPSRGVLLGTQPEHFPMAAHEDGNVGDELRAAGGGGIRRHHWAFDGDGSYEAYLMTALRSAHALLRGPNGSQAFAQLGFTGLQMSVWKQSAGNFEPSVMLGVVRAATSDASAAQLLARAGGPQVVRARFRLRACAPRREGAARHPSADWRQHTERRLAAAAGVPLLDAFAARLSRWDLHPGVQSGGVSSIRNTYDCAHSSPAPGAYDGEVAALQRLLDEGLISSAQRECGRTRVPPDELHTRHAGAELHQGVV